MKTAEIKEMTIKELKERIDADKTSLVRLKMNHTVSPLDNPNKIKHTRRDVARMVTVLKQRENEVK